MGASISYSGQPVNFYFQTYDSGNTNGVKQIKTSINDSPNSDIVNLLSPRDNKAGNGATATGAIFTNSSIPGQKIDIAYLFNKYNATIDFTVAGTAPYTGSIITTGINYANQSPSQNDPLFSPTFTVPTPTVDTTSTIKTTCTAIGAYQSFTVVPSQSPNNTTYYTVQSAAIEGGSLVLRLPGNYGIGTISGAFSIVPTGTLVRPTTFVATLVTGTGPAEWISSVLATPPQSCVTDINYGDKTTWSSVVGLDLSNYVVNGTISFAAQAYSTATLYIQYGVEIEQVVSVAVGRIEYSTNGGSNYTTAFTWTSTTSSSLGATSYILSLPGGLNLSQIFIRIRTQQNGGSYVLPQIYDMYIAYT
jgi:hypothetical protein